MRHLYDNGGFTFENNLLTASYINFYFTKVGLSVFWLNDFIIFVSTYLSFVLTSLYPGLCFVVMFLAVQDWKLEMPAGYFLAIFIEITDNACESIINTIVY